MLNSNNSFKQKEETKAQSFPLSSPLKSSSSDESKPKDCRICFLNINQKDILKNPCKCKGSMSYVHEQCLIKWLTQQNLRSCELCKNPFLFDEEYCAFPEIVRRTWKYITQDKKRIVMMCLYGLYLFLFGKRFIQLIKYFKELLVSIVRRVLRLEAKSTIKEALKQ